MGRKTIKQKLRDFPLILIIRERYDQPANSEKNVAQILDTSVKVVYTCVMNNGNKMSTVQELFELMYLALDFEKQIGKYGTDVQLSSSEIYLIKCIFENTNCCVTELAELTKVSKAAISQMIKKLKRKGMITIGYDLENKSRYQLNLTEKGLAANTVHLEINRELFESIYNLLSEYNENEVDRLRQFIAMTVKQIKSRINNL